MGTHTVMKELSNCETSYIFRHNSQTIKVTFYSIQFILAKRFRPSPISNSRTLSPFPKETLYVLIPLSPSALQVLIYFLSIWICLFWTFHTSKIIHYEAFYIWLLSLTVLFPRPIHVIIFIRTSFFSWPNNIPLCEHTSFCFSIYPLMDIWVVSTFLSLWIMLL